MTTAGTRLTDELNHSVTVTSCMWLLVSALFYWELHEETVTVNYKSKSIISPRSNASLLCGPMSSLFHHIRLQRASVNLLFNLFNLKEGNMHVENKSENSRFEM